MAQVREIVSTGREIESLIYARTDCVLLMDAGGVLFNNVIEESSFIDMVAEKFDVDAASLKRLYKLDDHRLESNKVCVYDFIESCLLKLGVGKLDGEVIRAIDGFYIQSVVRNEEMFS